MLVNASLALCDELERAVDCRRKLFSAYRHLSKTASGRARPRPAEILENALSQLALASRLVHQLRPILADAAKSMTLEI